MMYTRSCFELQLDYEAHVHVYTLCIVCSKGRVSAQCVSCYRLNIYYIHATVYVNAHATQYTYNVYSF